jgi:hypothetical protein
LKEIDMTWADWRVEVEQLLAALDGRVVIVMWTHMRGTGDARDGPLLLALRARLGGLHVLFVRAPGSSRAWATGRG